MGGKQENVKVANCILAHTCSYGTQKPIHSGLPHMNRKVSHGLYTLRILIVKQCQLQPSAILILSPEVPPLALLVALLLRHIGP